MKTSRFDHVVFGALHMELRGANANETIADMQRQGISMSHIRMREGACTLVIGLRDFPHAYRVCRSHGVKIHFIAKEGLPFALRHASRRKSLLVGVALFAAVLYGLNSMVWQVSVSGVKEDTAAAVLQAARDNGLYVGAFKSSIGSLEQIQRKILQEMPSLVWVGIQMEGTKAQLKVVERIPGVDVKEEQPHNVIASKPAVVRKVLASRGEVMVKPGQTVQPGQVLISGSLGGGSKLVPATGEVLAEVWYTSKVQLPLRVRQSQLTGAFVDHQYVVVGPLALRVWGWREPNYNEIVQRVNESDWHFGKWRLPVQWENVKDYEVNQSAVAKTVAQAQQQALDLAKQDVFVQMHETGAVLGQTVLQHEVTHGKLYTTVLTRVEENIGVPGPIQPPPAPKTPSS
ncbi:sporulation protein YqfD [Alicyclobacillus tolerans]|uniref:sporulation protein YqfD n=1 Tax=Alicyclobacillus tolerans TaxID=90970 RepID=UPI001F02C0D2|nr:sporulation protein YqfD [Alicyclobacillus tolerans]MCF8563336.1 sporulation protein YqfD [Alicyclobacillus tolerans]